jgi:ribosomal protein S12 methylthiotransferase
MKTFAVVSLGCPRNLVDSEVMAGTLSAEGYKAVKIEEGADVAIVNTCAFVDSAREESIDAIIEAAQFKKDGKVKYLVVCGCLPQLYKKKLSNELPEVDLIIGTSDFPKIAELLKGLGKPEGRVVVSSQRNYLYDESAPRSQFTPGHYAHVKISEGCSNFCSYCIISKLRGEFRSRRIESAIEEARRISESGKVKEIVLIGQDTTLYGADIYGKPILHELLRRLCNLENNVKWIRLLYTHPAHYTDELIDLIANEDKVCNYLDLPIQHISDKILRLMNRGVTRKQIEELIIKLRKRIPFAIL